MRIDHGVAVSLYTTDPNGILVEFSATVRSIVTAENRRRALELLTAAHPPVDGGPLSVESFVAARVCEVVEQHADLCRVRRRPGARERRTDLRTTAASPCSRSAAMAFGRGRHGDLATGA